MCKLWNFPNCRCHTLHYECVCVFFGFFSFAILSFGVYSVFYMLMYKLLNQAAFPQFQSSELSFIWADIFSHGLICLLGMGWNGFYFISLTHILTHCFISERSFGVLLSLLDISEICFLEFVQRFAFFFLFSVLQFGCFALFVCF